MTIWEYGAIAIALWAFTIGLVVGGVAVYVWSQLPAQPIRKYRQQLLIARIKIRWRQMTDSVLLRNKARRPR